MANPVDILIGKKAIEDFDILIAKTIKAQEEILKLGNDALIASKNISKVNTPSGVNANSSSASNITASLNKQTDALAKNQLQVDRLRLAEIKLQQAREKSVDSFTRKETKEQQLLTRSETAYNRIQGSVRKLTQTYQDLAIRRELGGNLTKREEAQLVSLTNRLNMYQGALKKVDADIQKNQRNVGNYASGWNGLGNSINQITRELPAFTFSAQTGILALSNNIPILTDEIGKLQRANAELIKQGKPVKSVFSQIAGAFISWQTAMGVGILLLTLYGKEIGSFVKNMFSFEKALTAASIAQKSMTESSKEGLIAAQDELAQLKINLGIAEDVTKSYKQRKLAVDTLKETYPDYLKNISDEAILSGKAEEAINLLTIAIINNAKAQAAKTRILENETKRLDLLDEEVRLNQELIEQDKQNIKLEQRMKDEVKVVSDRNTALTRYNDGTAKSLSLRRQLASNQEELNKLDETNKILTDYAIKNTTLFDDKKEKAAKKAKAAKRENIEDIKIESRATNSLLDSLEEQIRLIKILQNAMAKSTKGWSEYQKVIDQLQYGIDTIKNGNEEIQKTAQKGIDAAKKEEQMRLDQIRRMKELKKATDEYIKTFSDSFLGSIGLGSLNKFFDGTFDRLLLGADSLKEKFAVTFLAISEVAKEAFNFMSNASQANFDAEYSRLEKQKDVAIKNAGEGTAAQQAITEQYEERKRAIAKREAEAQKKLAIFNILINTAQGVVSALASTPPNVPLSIAIGIIGAVQAGIVGSQQIPAFFEGGEHDGGLMLVNDGKGSNYRETIVTPDGRVMKPQDRNTIMNAPKGTQIYTHDQWQAQMMKGLLSQGITANVQSNSLTKDEYNNGVERIIASNNRSGGGFSFDERGVNKWKENNGRRQIVLNNRLEVK